MLAPLAGRIYHHAPQQNAFPLGIEGEFMASIGSWAALISGSVVLAGFGVLRRRGGMPREHLALSNAMMLLAFGMIIGNLPWALDWGGETIRIIGSAISILASLIALVLLARLFLASARRHDA